MNMLSQLSNMFPHVDLLPSNPPNLLHQREGSVEMWTAGTYDEEFLVKGGDKLGFAKVSKPEGNIGDELLATAAALSLALVRRRDEISEGLETTSWRDLQSRGRSRQPCN